MAVRSDTKGVCVVKDVNSVQCMEVHVRRGIQWNTNGIQGKNSN